MLFDSTNLFSDAQAITATAVSTNVIDFGATDTPKHAANAITRDIGKGTPVFVRVQVVTDFADTGSDSTLTVTVQTDDNDSFSSATDLISATSGANPAAGYVFPLLVLPRGIERYVRLNYTVANGNFSAGAVTAGLVFSHEQRDV